MMIPELPVAGNFDSYKAADTRKDTWHESPQVLLARIISRMETVLLGKRDVIQLALIAMLGGGHILLEDVPGVGKTNLARAFARVLGGQFSRIQFTSDLLPADVVGGSIWDARKGEFRFPAWSGHGQYRTGR